MSINYTNILSTGTSTITSNTSGVYVTSDNTYYSSYSTTREYTLDDHKFTMDRYLCYEEVSFIVNLTLNGTRYYDLSVENGINLQYDLLEKIDPIIKMMRRKEKARNILDKK